MKKIISGLLVFFTSQFVFSAPPKISGHLVGIAGRSLNQSSATVSDLLTDYYLGLDWSFSPYPEVSGFARTSVFGDGHLFLEQSFLQFLPNKKFKVTGFYRQKAMMLTDPLKVLSQPVSLKYERVEFSDEFNEYKFRGQNDQGLVISADLTENTRMDVFYSDRLNPTTYYTTVEDNLALRLEKKFSGIPLRVGLNYVLARGIHWPYAENNDWFPDPENTAGYSFSASSRSSVSLWYKGYQENNFFSVDGLFDFSRNVGLWVESAQELENLSAVRKSDDISCDKRWEISKKDITAVGLRGKFAKIRTELNYNNERQNFSLPYSADSYPLEKNIFSFTSRYNFAADNFVGFSARKFQVNRKTGENIPAEIHPLRRDYLNILPDNTGGYFSLLVPEAEGLFQLQLKEKVFQLNSLVAMETGKTLQIQDSGGEVFSSSEQLADYQNAEGLLDFKLKLIGNFYWENAGRLVYYRMPAVERIFFNNYSGVSWRLNEAIFFRLGYGLDPDDYRDDIKIGFDRRTYFLYNLTSAGEDILSAEEKLARETRFAFRTEIRF